MTLSFKDPQLEPVRKHLERGQEAMREREPAEAAKHFRQAHEAAAERGIVSSFILWNLAIASDYSGSYEVAFDSITTALDLDPFSGTLRESFDIIARRVRGALADAERAVDDPTTPELYALLVRHDEADVASHAVMARFHAAVGAAEPALTLANALTTLHPADPAAWACKRDVAVALGDAATADACKAELAALAGTKPRLPVLVKRGGDERPS